MARGLRASAATASVSAVLTPVSEDGGSSEDSSEEASRGAASEPDAVVAAWMSISVVVTSVSRDAPRVESRSQRSISARLWRLVSRFSSKSGTPPPDRASLGGPRSGS